MKKIFSIITFIILSFGCSSDVEPNQLLPNIQVDQTVDLSLPQYVNLLVPGGWVDDISGGVNGIVLYRIKTNEYKAFDRACPQNNCTTKMTFDGSIKLKCSCHNRKFSILDGSPQTNGIIYSAREYRVSLISGSILRITNF